MLTYRTLLVLFVVIELFPNSVFQLHCPNDYYMMKQWNTLPVTMVTEIMNFNDYNLFGANVYKTIHMLHDYVHLDNL